MIVDIVGWLCALDVAAALTLGLLVYVIGRRSPRPVPPRAALTLTILLAAPAVVLYACVWLCWRLGDG